MPEEDWAWKGRWVKGRGGTGLRRDTGSHGGMDGGGRGAWEGGV